MHKYIFIYLILRMKFRINGISSEQNTNEHNLELISQNVQSNSGVKKKNSEREQYNR